MKYDAQTLISKLNSAEEIRSKTLRFFFQKENYGKNYSG
jgi:hypothetical protein